MKLTNLTILFLYLGFGYWLFFIPMEEEPPKHLYRPFLDRQAQITPYDNIMYPDLTHYILRLEFSQNEYKDLINRFEKVGIFAYLVDHDLHDLRVVACPEDSDITCVFEVLDNYKN